jgi:formylglycine-generating enzyme required for sulfatase activity
MPVGSFSANGYGLYDMAGNLWELVNDWYAENYYSQSPSTNPLGPESGSSKLLRGGSWGDEAEYLRAANRATTGQARPANGFGIRCARDIPLGSAP